LNLGAKNKNEQHISH